MNIVGMKVRFTRIWRSLTGHSFDGERVFDNLIDMYSQPIHARDGALHRIAVELLALDRWASQEYLDGRRYQIAFLTIWFHDVMRQPEHAGSDVFCSEESAQLFSTYALGFKDPEISQEIAHAIRRFGPSLRNELAVAEVVASLPHLAI